MGDRQGHRRRVHPDAARRARRLRTPPAGAGRPAPSSRSPATGSSSQSVRARTSPGSARDQTGPGHPQEALQADAVTFLTDRPGVFGSGDVRIGAATVVQAIAEGRRSAYAVDAHLKGLDLSAIKTRQPLAEPQPEFLSIVPFTSRAEGAALPHEGDARPTSATTAMSSTRSRTRGGGGRRVRPAASSARARRSGSATFVGSGSSTGTTLQTLEPQHHQGAGYRSVTENRFTGINHDYVRDDSHAFILREPSRCIDCGRCANVCAEVVGAACYDFMRIGFDTLVTTPLDMSLNDTPCVSCGRCAETCPTGALMPKPRVLQKYDVDESRCILCGICVDACPYDALRDGGEFELSHTSRAEPMIDLIALAAVDRETEITYIRRERDWAPARGRRAPVRGSPAPPAGAPGGLAVAAYVAKGLTDGNGAWQRQRPHAGTASSGPMRAWIDLMPPAVAGAVSRARARCPRPSAGGSAGTTSLFVVARHADARLRAPGRDDARHHPLRPGDDRLLPALAGIYVVVGAPLVAAAQVIVYIGAISVLILFAIMLTQSKSGPARLVFQTQAVPAGGRRDRPRRSSSPEGRGDGLGRGRRAGRLATDTSRASCSTTTCSVRDRQRPAPRGGDRRRLHREARGGARLMGLADSLDAYLILAGALFAIGIFGFLARRNAISMLMSIELMLQRREPLDRRLRRVHPGARRRRLGHRPAWSWRSPRPRRRSASRSSSRSTGTGRPRSSTSTTRCAGDRMDILIPLIAALPLAGFLHHGRDRPPARQARALDPGPRSSASSWAIAMVVVVTALTGGAPFADGGYTVKLWDWIPAGTFHVEAGVLRRQPDRLPADRRHDDRPARPRLLDRLHEP